MGGDDRYVPHHYELEGRREAQQDYPEYMRDVEFPYGAADNAIETCERIASLLEDHLRARPDMVAGATDDWSGGYCDDFNATWKGGNGSEGQEMRLGLLKEALRAFAGSIGDAWDEVVSINNARATDRENYEPGEPTRPDAPIGEPAPH